MLNLLSSQGRLGFISSNKFFSAKYGLKLREQLIDMKSIEIILNFGSGIFEDTPVETSIIILNNTHAKNTFKYNNYPKVRTALHLTANRTASIIDYSILPSKIFFFPDSKADTIIINRIKKFKNTISDFYKFTAGYGITGIKDKLKTTSFAESIPVYTGKSIWRYYNKEPEYWIKNNSIRDFNSNEAGLIRELSTKNRATMIYKQRIGLLNSVTVVESKHEKIPIHTFISIFNSKLFSRLYCIFYESTRTHSNLRFKEHYLNPIPIPDLLSLKLSNLYAKSKEMVVRKNELIVAKDKFLGRVAQNLKLPKVSNKLDVFYELSFSQFYDELKKKKIVLSIKQQDEWEDYFEDHKSRLQKLKQQIDKIDHEIDQMVYKFYGLTEAEKKIVEESLK